MSDDIHLQHAVLAEFAWEPSVNAAHIGVTARNGVVTLTGHVPSYLEKHAAETAAARVKGVRAVADEIVVRLPSATRRDDDAIAAAAVDRLAWDALVPAHAISIKVEHGRVTLTGQVEWHYQRAAAALDVGGLFGVTGVNNHITIAPRVDTAGLDDAITHALHRSWFFNPGDVKVTAEGGKVRLTGTVRTPHERQVAAATAWAAPGTTAVVNDIDIA